MTALYPRHVRCERPYTVYALLKQTQRAASERGKDKFLGGRIGVKLQVLAVGFLDASPLTLVPIGGVYPLT